MKFRPQVRLALRNAVKDLVLSKTGPVSTVSAAPGGYTRTTGSFVADGFNEGDDLTVSGFTKASNNGRALVSLVTANTLSVTRDVGENALVLEPAGASVTLQAMVPRTLSEPNRGKPGDTAVPKFYPWWRETIKPLSSTPVTIGQNPRIVSLAIYMADLFWPRGVGANAAEKATSEICRQLPPGTLLINGSLRIEIIRSQSFDEVANPTDAWALFPTQLSLRITYDG